MYKQQLPDTMSDRFRQFMDDFGLEWPTVVAELPFLEAEWWGFAQDSGNPAHRTKAFRAAWELFSEARYTISTAYHAWLHKYTSAAHEWSIIKESDRMIPLYTAQLRKPLGEYSVRNGVIQNEAARSVSHWINVKHDAERYFDKCMAIDDNPPTPNYDEIERLWEIVQHLITSFNPKKPIKKKIVETQVVALDASREGDCVYFKVEDAIRAIKGLGNDVSFFGAVQVRTFDIGQWLRVLKKGFITLTRTPDGVKLDYKENDNGTGLRVTATFREPKEKDEFCHMVVLESDLNE